MMMIGESIEAHGSHKHQSQVLSQIKSKSWGLEGEGWGMFCFFCYVPNVFSTGSQDVPIMF
jgi:hypothetical protein